MTIKEQKKLGATLNKLPFIKQVEPVETNIVIFEIDGHYDEKKFIKLLKDKQIHIIGMGNGKLRMVTHLDYTDVMHAYLLEQLETLRV